MNGSSPAHAPATTPRRALPDTWHQLVEYETQAAYWHGQQAAYTAIAAGHAELAAAWRATGRLTYEHHVAERHALFQACAAAGHNQRGTTEWAGLANGAELPTADWGKPPTARHLARVA